MNFFCHYFFMMFEERREEEEPYAVYTVLNQSARVFG